MIQVDYDVRIWAYSGFRMALLTPRAAAGRLGVSYSTLKQWIYKGTMRTVRTGGGHHRIADAEIERMLAAQGRPLRAPRRKTRAAPGVLVAISGRNQLRGIVDEIRVDGLLAQVRLRIGDQRLTAVITRDAIDELKLKRGASALAIIKSTEVMIAREQTASAKGNG
jgi:molybdopterin-binding protein